MKKWHQPSGLTSGLAVKVDPNWTPEQALAVWELLDDLRNRIATHYGFAIQNCMRQQRQPHQSIDDLDQDLPF